MTRSLGLVFVLFVVCCVADPHPNLIHKRSILCSNDFQTFIPSIASDSQNNVISVGYNRQPQVFTAPFVSKHDADLKVLWNTTLSNSIAERMLLQLDKEDNIYIAGYFGQITNTLSIPTNPKNESSHGIISNGENDIFIAKLDPSGNLLWAGSIGNETDEIVGTMHVSEKGTIGLVGVQSQNQWFISRLNTDGSLAWQHSMGPSASFGISNNFAIAVDANDGVIVAHSYTQPTTLLNQQLPYKEKDQHNGLLIKFNAAGDMQWVQTWNQPYLKNTTKLISREFTRMALGKDGSIYAAGKDSVNVPLGAFVVKVNATGHKMWEVKLEGWIEDIKIGPDGNIYTIGSYSESYPETDLWEVSKPELPKTRRSSAFVVKISPKGKILWKNAFTEYKFITGNSIAVMRDHKIAIAFGFSNEASFGGETFKTKSMGMMSAVLATYTQLDNIKEEL